MYEYFLKSLGVSADAVGAKMRETDEHLKEHTDWQHQFPGLFAD